MYLNLIKTLLLREFQILYKRSFFGTFWLFISPLISFITWFILNRMRILSPGETIVPYPVFVLSGTLIWAMMQSLISSLSGLYSSYRPFLLNFKMPFRVIISVLILFNFIKFTVSYSIFIALICILGVKVSLSAALLPFLVIPIVLLGSAIGILSAPFVLIAPEFRKIMNSLFSLTMIFTPIVYVKGSVKPGIIASVVDYNPLTYLIVFIRDMIFSGRSEYLTAYFTVLLGSFIFFLYSLRFLIVTRECTIEKLL